MLPSGLLAALAVAFFLGLPHLGSEQLWFDEVLSWSIYRRSPTMAEMTAYLASNENHPPLYYYLMRGWTAMVGDAPAMLRLPSVLFTVLTVGLLYALARRWFGHRIAAMAAMIAALSPLAVEFSREARPYALLSALAVASWLALSRFLDSGNAWWMAGYVALTLGGLYTHYAYVFLAASQFLLGSFVASRPPSRASPWRGSRTVLLAAAGAMAAGYAPWMSVLAAKLAEQYIYPAGLTPLAQLATPPNFILADMVFNVLFLPAKWPADGLGRTAEAMAVVGVLVGVVIAGRAAWRAYGQTAETRSSAIPWGRLLMVLVWCLVPPLLYLFSPIAGRYSWYYHRHLITVLPAIALLTALGLDQLGRLLRPMLSPAVVGVGVALLVSINVPQYMINDSRWDPQHQFADVSRYLEQHAGDGRELILGFWADHRILLDYSYRGRQTVGSLVPQRRYSNQLEIVSGLPRLTPMEGYLLTHPSIPYRRYRLPDALADYDRIWVVSLVPDLFDLDVALAAAGFRPTFVELPEPIRLALFRFERGGAAGKRIATASTAAGGPFRRLAAGLPPSCGYRP